MNLEPTLLSVVVPLSNPNRELPFVDKWIREALSEKIELVFVLDYFLESDLELYKDYFSSFQQYDLKFVQGNFSSPGRARSEGTSITTSRWIAYWDGDDIPFVSDFCRMVEAADAVNANLTMGGFQKKNYFENSYYLHPVPENVTDVKGYFLRNPGIWRFAFKKALMNEVKFQDFSMGEDLIFLSRNVSNIHEVFRWNAVVYSYSTGDKRSLTSNRRKFGDGIGASRHLWHNFLINRNSVIPYVFAMHLALTVVRRGTTLDKLRGISLVGKYLTLSPVLFLRNSKDIFKRT